MKALTEEYIHSLKFATDIPPYYVVDSHKNAPKGFGLRVTRSTKTFLIRYNHHGRWLRYTIGSHPAWSLVAARKEATILRADIERGIDIRKYRVSLDAGHGSEGAGEDPGITLAKALELYKASHLENIVSGERVNSALKKYLLDFSLDEAGRLGDKLIKDIRRGEVIQAIECAAKTVPRQASIVLTYAKAMFEWAEDREVCINPIASLRPVKISRSMAAKRRDRILDHDEIRGFWENVEQCGIETITALALKMVLVTGQRPGEVAGMSEVEIMDRVWSIPGERRKTGVPHAIYLNDRALEMADKARAEVERLSKRRKMKPVGYIFEARAGQKITPNALNRAVSRYAKHLKIKNKKGRWTPHDLRRTCRTGLAACGVPKEIAELVIGHTQKGVVAVYDQHQYADEIRIALARWERFLMLIIGARKGSEQMLKLDTSWVEDLMKG